MTKINKKEFEQWLTGYLQEWLMSAIDDEKELRSAIGSTFIEDKEIIKAYGKLDGFTLLGQIIEAKPFVWFCNKIKEKQREFGLEENVGEFLTYAVNKVMIEKDLE